MGVDNQRGTGLGPQEGAFMRDWGDVLLYVLRVNRTREGAYSGGILSNSAHASKKHQKHLLASYFQILKRESQHSNSANLYCILQMSDRVLLCPIMSLWNSIYRSISAWLTD